MDLDKNAKFAVALHEVRVRIGFGSSGPEILKGISLTVETGTIFGLLGPSGCGKTTLLKCVIASLKPNQGIVKVFNQTPGSPASGIPGSAVGYMPQELALYPDLTIGETLTFFGRLHFMKKEQIKSRIKFLVDFLNLTDLKVIRYLSGGEQRRVSLAIALLHQPPLLILDEPTVGVDPVLRQSIWNYLHKISATENVSVIVTTHYIEEARKANKIALMRNGELLAEDSPDSLLLRYNASTLEDVFLQLCQDEFINYEVKTNERNETKIESYKVIKETSIEQQNSDKYPHYADDKLSFVDCRLPSLTRIKAVTILNFIKMWRNVMLLVFQFASPVFQIFVLLYSIGGEPRDLRIAVYNEDISLGSRYLSYLNNQTILQVPVPNQAVGEDLVTYGKAWGVINIWPNFTAALIQRMASPSSVLNDTMDAGSVHVRLDYSDMQITFSLQRALYSAFKTFSTDILREVGTNISLPEIPIKFDQPIYGSLDSTFLEFLAPGMIAPLIFFLALNLTAISFVSDKTQGLLSRTYVSGVSSFELMSGYILTQIGVTIIQAIIFLVITINVFHVPNKGSIILAILLVIMQGLSGMTFGFLISVLANNEITAMVMATGFFFPLYLTCGGMWPIEGMPPFLHTVSQYQPLTWPIIAMQWIMTHGRGITWFPVWRGFLVTWTWSLICIILSVFVMRIKK